MSQFFNNNTFYIPFYFYLIFRKYRQEDMEHTNPKEKDYCNQEKEIK